MFTALIAVMAATLAVYAAMFVLAHVAPLEIEK